MSGYLLKMKRHMVIYKQFDVVVVLFLFTDNTATKKRPAVVISDATFFNQPLKKSVMAMITTTGHTPWALDTLIADLTSAGLKTASLIRMKLFTLDDGLIVKKIGHLASEEQSAVSSQLKQLLNL